MHHTRTAGALAVAVLASPAWAQLPAVPVPPENPITEAKRVLGKMLFWEAQLSSDNSVSCGTCHIENWVDPFWLRHPGPDGVKHTDDDKLGSTGMRATDRNGHYLPHPMFGFKPQATSRQSPPPILAMFADDIFWDGRATSEFVDPETGETIISRNGALESQAAGPPVNPAEMAHTSRRWPHVIAKLARSRPLAIATDLPPDVAEALEGDPSYPDLFADAFGSDEITGARIAMAIATYERTLVPDQTPYDRFMDGADSLTDAQEAGWEAFKYSRCASCHQPPLFTTYQFRNVGLRPPGEDLGRFLVTRNTDDRGKFKVASLREIKGRNRYFHTGMYRTLEEVFDFYARRSGSRQFSDNRDPLLAWPIEFTETDQANVIDFIENGLSDPRVELGLPPFDRPTLHNELPDNPIWVAAGRPGSGDLTPQMITPSTPNLDNDTFNFGIHQALGGVEARVGLHRTLESARDGGPPALTLGPITLDGDGVGEGYGTITWHVPDDPSLLGDVAYAVWSVDDPNRPRVQSAVYAMTFYRSDPTSCGCSGDLDCDGVVGYEDLIIILSRWGECSGLCGADLDNDGIVGFEDLIVLLQGWGDC